MPHDGHLEVPPNEKSEDKADPPGPRLNPKAPLGEDPLVLLPHEDVDGPLFPDKPDIESFRQGRIGDCFLLGTILAILAVEGGPEFIEGMMVEEKGWFSKSVIVRLFSSGKAKYLRLRRTLLSGNKRATGPLWAQFIEKAYAALHGSYDRLHFGQEADAFSALLGAAGEEVAFADLLAADQKNVTDLFTCSRDTYEDALTALRDAGNPSPVPPGLKWADDIQRVFQQVFGDDVADRDNWFNWASNKQDAWNILVGSKRYPPAPGLAPTPHETTLRIEDVEKFMREWADQPGRNDATLDDAIQTRVIAWIKLAQNQFLPGRRGTGVYSAAQELIFATIQAALLANKPVVAGSNDDVGGVRANEPVAAGHSGNEPKVRGLVGGHTYAVLDTKIESESGRCWVLVTHPWQHYGREYDSNVPGKPPDVLSAVATQDSVSWLELSDLTKRFRGVRIAAEPLPALLKKASPVKGPVSPAFYTNNKFLPAPGAGRRGSTGSPSPGSWSASKKSRNTKR